MIQKFVSPDCEAVYYCIPICRTLQVSLGFTRNTEKPPLHR
jgi:hypothetical protein